MRLNTIFIVLVFLLSGCLVTRQGLRESVKEESLTPDQQRKSDDQIRYQEVEELQRQLTGRLEVLENSMNIISADRSGNQLEMQNDKRILNEKLKIYEDTLSKLETQYMLLAQRVDALSVAAAAKSASASVDKGSFTAAEDAFAKKKWKESIVAFEKYRTLNPKGRHYAEATYKIANSFSELNMNSEAKAFYSEVVEKFAKSEWAKKAQQRLKSLK